MTSGIHETLSEIAGGKREMEKFKFRKPLVVIILVSLLFFGVNYRFTPLAAAKAHFDVGNEAVTLGDVDFGWGKVYVFDTDSGPRSVISIKSWFLWRAPAAVHFEPSTDVIRTVGWMSYFDKKGQATVFAVESTDPQIAFVEIGSPNERVRKEITPATPTIFSWNRAIQSNELDPVAYSADNKPLFEYRYPKNTSTIRSEDLKWYPVNGDN